jgi:hypothetical protein
LVAVGGGQLACVVAALEIVGEGDARFADRGELGAALGDDLVFVEGGVVVSVMVSESKNRQFELSLPARRHHALSAVARRGHLHGCDGRWARGTQGTSIVEQTHR